MDPDLQDLLGKVQQAVAAGKAKGTQINPADLDAYIREESKGKYTLDDVANAHVQQSSNMSAESLHPSAGVSALIHGADDYTYGAGHKLVAAAMSLSQKGDLSDYPKIRDGLEEGLAAQRAQHPAASLAGGFAGGLLSPINEVLPGGMVRGAGAAGAISGGVGANGDAADHVQGALTGGLLGALTGGLMKGAGAAAGYAKPAFSGAAQVAKAIAESGGVQKVRDAAQKFIDAGKGDIMSLADLSPALQGLADHSAQVSDQARSDIGTMTEGRQLTQGARAIGDVRAQLGTVPNAPELRANMEKALADWSKTAYDGIRAQNPQVDGSYVANIMSNPKLQSAWQAARLADDIKPGDGTSQLIARITADNPNWSPDAVKQAAEGGVAPLYGGAPGAAAATPRPVSYNDLFMLKKQLDNKIGAAYKAGTGPLADSYSTIRDGVNDALNQVQDHADVTAKYADAKRNIEAVEQGEQDWANTDVRGIQRRMAELTPLQQTFYRHGMASKLIEQLSQPNANQDIGRTMANAGTDMQAKLQTVFGSQQGFDDYMAANGAEKKLSQLKLATGGSPSARRLLTAQNVLAGASAATGALGHSPVAAAGLGVGAAASYGARTLMAKAGTDASGLLTTQGKDPIMQLLDEIEQNGQQGPLSAMAGRAGAGVAGQAAAAIPGLLAR